MPNTEELRQLRADVAALAASIAGLEPALQNAVSHREVQAIKDFTERQRKRTTWAAVISVLIAMFVTIGVNNAMLTRCFLVRSSQLRKDTACNVFFPGYNRVVEEQHRQIGQFNKLLRSIPENSRVNNRQNAKIHELERRLHNLGG